MSFDNEVNSLLTVVTPPSLFYSSKGPKIFLAGSINNGQATNWQSFAVNYINEYWRDESIVVYNPRRQEEYTPDMDNEQMLWTFSMLEASDYILMHLTGDGASPASLLELGLYMKSGKLFISVDESYTRKEMVEFHNGFYGKNKIYQTVEQSIEEMKKDWKEKNGIN